MTENALESQSHDQDVKVNSSTTETTNAIKGGAPISPKPFISTADLEADMRSEWKSVQDQRNADRKAAVEKKSSGKPDAGKQAEPKDQAMLKELEKKFNSDTGNDQSVEEEKEASEVETLKTDSESVDNDKSDKKEEDKSKKSPVQKKIDRLFARTKEAEDRSDKLHLEKIELEKKLEIYSKEYKHLLSLTKEDPKDVLIRKMNYDRELEDIKRTSADQLKSEKAKMLKELQQSQQESLIIQESESLAEKYFTVSSEEILLRGSRDVRKPLEQIAKELHTERLKRAGVVRTEEKKVSAPKTTANVGSSIKDIDFDDTPDGWRAYLKSKGRDV